GQSVQCVVGHRPVAGIAGGAVADRRHVAVLVVVVAVVQVHRAAIRVAAAVGQAADVLGQGVGDVVAVGYRLDRAVGVVGHRAGIRAGLRRLAQGIGLVGDVEAVPLLCREVAVGVVDVGDRLVDGAPHQPFAGHQPTAVVGVLGRDQIGAAVVGQDRGQLA